MRRRTTPQSASGELPLHLRVQEGLRARLLDGTYPPQSRLPSEHALCAQFQVSRITVRQALAALQNEGLVQKIQGRGTFACRPRAAQNVSTLQGFAEAMAPLGHDVRNRLHQFRYVPAGESLAGRLQLPATALLAEIGRVRVLDGQPISYETTYVPEVLGQALAGADLAHRDLFHILEHDGRVALGHADVAITSELADEALCTLLQCHTGSPVLRIDRLVSEAGGAPLLYETLRFRADAFQYRMRVDRQGRTALRP